MKTKLIAALCLSIVIIACRKSNPEVEPVTSKSLPHSHFAQRFSDTTDTFNSRFISVNLANSMINSYLYSINYEYNDTDVRSFSVNADSLRSYLENSSIKKLKLIFAHTPAYINSGKSGEYAGYQSGAITIVIAAYDASGNYIYHNGQVLDYSAPCPYSCPSGSAGNNLLQ